MTVTPASGDADGQLPDYLGTFAKERAFLARQCIALGLLAASVAAVELLPTRIVAVALALTAAFFASSGLLRWRSIGRDS